jgi:hypothetical protein
MDIEQILYILCLILLFIFLIQVIFGNIPVPVPPRPPNPPNPTNPLVGGCAGTRYGCCPDGKTPKMNFNGSNC